MQLPLYQKMEGKMLDKLLDEMVSHACLSSGARRKLNFDMDSPGSGGDIAAKDTD